MIKLRCLAIVALLALPALAAQAARKTEGKAYLGAIVIEAESGQVLFEDNADAITPPASMTKLMTFAVLHDKLTAGALTLETPVVVTAADAKIGGTQVWLKEKEVFTVEELIYAMMIQSANDAAHALARAAAGSPEAFVELMNAKARTLGMTHTTFRTPHGLPPVGRHVADGDLSTPRDYATLSRYLVTETDVTKYTSVRERRFGEGKRTADRVTKMENHNHLLGKVAGLDGLKTGFTNGASFCLAATAERNGRRIISVVMGSPDSKGRDLKTVELIERGFSALPAPLPKLSTGPAPAAVPARPTAVPVIRTDKTAAPSSPSEQNSTSTEAPLTFRVIPPPKKP